MELRRLFAFVALAAAADTAAAASFCITNVSQLQTALTTAASNGEDDTIYIRNGTYLLTAELNYYAASDETHRLAIFGGIGSNCQSYDTSGYTALDGQNARRILTINAYGEVDIGRITFQNGNPSQYFGGALNLSNNGADTYVFTSLFVGNDVAAGNAGGAMYIYSSNGGDIFVFSNAFLANSSSGGAIYANGTGNTYLTGNTILANSLINHTGLTGGVDIAGTGNIWLSNNILWNNENADVYDQAGHARYTNNDIGVQAGFAPLSAANELSVDPDFNGFLSLRPKPESPMVNAGFDTPPGGVGGCCDPSGGQRVQGRHVDIGAYETDVLFRDVFGN